MFRAYPYWPPPNSSLFLIFARVRWAQPPTLSGARILSPRRPSSHDPERILELYFDDNHALPNLFGPNNEYLNRIEEALGVSINALGNTVTVSGSTAATHRAQETFDALWDRIQNNLPIEEGDVAGALRIAQSTVDPAMKQMAMAAFSDKPRKVVTKRKHISPRSTTQAA